MFGSGFEIFGILGSLLVLALVIATVIINPAITVQIAVLAAFVNLGIMVRTCFL